MTFFFSTNYREHGARQLVTYLKKDRGLENRFGESMAADEIETFIERSEAYGFEREVILSPENRHELSDAQFSLATRQLMSDVCTDRPTATYCFAIHRDTDHPHVHVALTGTKRDLRIDQQGCDQLREQAQEQYFNQFLSQDLSHQFEQTFQEELEHVQEITRENESEHEQELE